MTEQRKDRIRELLKTVFKVSDVKISQFFLYTPEVAEDPDLLPKLEYAAAHDPADKQYPDPNHSLGIYSFFRLTYDDFLACAAFPDRMGFSEEERGRYNAQILNWGHPEDPRPLKPVFTELCDEEHADSIIRELCFPACRIWPEDIRTICERLLSYPVRIDPKWFGDYWFLLFSPYADPIRILDELDKRFQPEHVMEVFMSRRDWGRIGYGLGGGLIGEMWVNPRYADEAFEEAEKKFADFRL